MSVFAVESASHVSAHEEETMWRSGVSHRGIMEDMGKNNRRHAERKEVTESTLASQQVAVHRPSSTHSPPRNVPATSPVRIQTIGKKLPPWNYICRSREPREHTACISGGSSTCPNGHTLGAGETGNFIEQTDEAFHGKAYTPVGPERHRTAEMVRVWRCVGRTRRTGVSEEVHRGQK